MLYIRNIYKEGELDENRTCNYYLQVQDEGGREVARDIKFYNLDMILAIGYRVRSNVGMQFRNLQVQNEGGREVERKIKFFFATVQNKLLYAVTGQFV